MSFLVAYYMHKGLRKTQEDCILVNGEIVQVDYMDFPAFKKIESNISLFAVCDGMGGLLHGKRASRFVCERLKEKVQNIQFSKEWILETLRNIQDEFMKTSLTESGTTVAGVLLEGGNSIIFNAGDSRVYKLTPEKIMYLSHDHSYVQELVDTGEISYEEAFYHPYKNIITFGIGDVFHGEWKEGMKPYTVEDRLEENQYYLLCTDGVNDVLKDEEIFQFLMPDPFNSVDSFISEIKKRMSDNFSFIIVSKSIRGEVNV